MAILFVDVAPTFAAWPIAIEPSADALVAPRPDEPLSPIAIALAPVALELAPIATEKTPAVTLEFAAPPIATAPLAFAFDAAPTATEVWFKMLAVSEENAETPRATLPKPAALAPNPTAVASTALAFAPCPKAEAPLHSPTPGSRPQSR
jgi:hypothetical protein